MTAMRFDEARSCVLAKVRASGKRTAVERAPLDEVDGRVLAEDVVADRDYPPLARSIRDGFAVRSEDMPGKVKVIGEVRAGERFRGRLGAGEAVDIMTGAPVPDGADAVVMVEHTARDGSYVSTERAPKPGEFIVPPGAECGMGDVVAAKGRRAGYAIVAMLATVGHEYVAVHARPRVAIIATGDEIIESGTPLPHQIRNSNAHSLAAQVRRAGGAPEILPIARDTFESTRGAAEAGFRHDLVLFSGGVSAGKYDIVERVLEDFGAEFYFNRVRIQPGQPLVFGSAGGTFFFGLPGNPASTMVTFELFGKPAIQLIGGEAEPELRFTLARLTEPFRHKAGLKRFLPATLRGPEVTPVRWQGSGDVASLSRANAFLIAEEDRESWDAGDSIEVMPQ